MKVYISFLLFYTATLKSEAIMVRTNNGFLRGRFVNHPSVSLNYSTPYLAWEGIPYASPPVGPLRWLPPISPPRWPGVLDATKPGSPCIQMSMSGKLVGEEDCLYLNIYSPITNGPGSKPLPVMVWTHGGGLVRTYGDFFNADLFLETEAVILVTTNFRLGSLGFLALDDQVSGNQGLRDQAKALQWIRNNIVLFGGDRDRVTLFGQGSGSWMVGYLLLSPLASGLFQGAILQGMVHWGGPSFDTSTKQQAVAQGNKIAHELNCMEEESTACIQSKTGKEVIMAGLKIYNHNLPLINVDGFFLPDHPKSLLAQGKYNKVPVIIGSTSREGIPLAYTPSSASLDKVGSDLNRWLQLLSTPTLKHPSIVPATHPCFSEIGRRTLNLYFGGYVTGAKHSTMMNMVADLFTWQPTTSLAISLAANTPVFYYIMDIHDNTKVPWTPKPLNTFFSSLGIQPPKDDQFYLGLYPTDSAHWSQDAWITSTAMLRIWTSFAMQAVTMNNQTTEFSWEGGSWSRINGGMFGEVESYLNITSGNKPSMMKSNLDYKERMAFWKQMLRTCS